MPAAGLDAVQLVPFQRSTSGATSPPSFTVKPTATTSSGAIAVTPVSRDLPAAAPAMFPPVHTVPSQRATSGSSFPLPSTEYPTAHARVGDRELTAASRFVP